MMNIIKPLKKLDIKNYELVKDSHLDTEEFKIYDDLFLQINATQVDHNLLEIIRHG